MPLRKPKRRTPPVTLKSGVPVAVPALSHSDAAIGKFAAGSVRTVPDGLASEIWLTPFELGIRQDFALQVRPGKFQDIFEVEVQLTRLSGDDRNWWRANRRFLAELRKQFLQWRTVSASAVSE